MPRPGSVTDPTTDEQEASSTVSLGDEGVDVNDDSDQGADEDEDDAIDGSAESDSPSRGRLVRGSGGVGDGASSDDRTPPLIPTIVFGVLAVVGLLGTLVFGFAWASQRNADNAEQSMKTTAGDFLTALLQFDAQTIDADFDNILSYATGDFADQADQQFADDDTRNALRETQASSRVEIRDLFVQSFDGDRGRVFAIADQRIANNRIPNPISDQIRLEMTMRKVDGEWKVSGLDVLEAPAAQAAIAGGTVPTGSSGTTPTTAGG